MSINSLYNKCSCLKWLQWKFLILANSLEVYIGLIDVFFTVLGVWIAARFVKPKVQEVVVEKEIYVPHLEEDFINEAELDKFNLTERPVAQTDET